MTKKLNSNEDLVVDLMNYSPYGAMSQMFIMCAIQDYAERVIKSAPWAGEHPLLDEATWRACAADIKLRCDQFYGRHTTAIDPAMPDDDEWDEVVAHFGLDSSFSYSNEAMKSYTHDYRVHLEQQP